MKIIDPERWIFTFTALAITAVFILLTPSTTIIARWFPGKTDWLWLYPSILFALSFILWLIYRLKLPSLIEKGFFEDRRKDRIPIALSPSARTWRWVRPMLRLFMQVFLIAALCSSALTFMRSGKNRDLLVTVAQDPIYSQRAQNHKW
ncbi:MAG: hypothetical protein KBC91_00485 [Candidatus Omnitrophica bacterium]|nr:hypothetical protein [Candidatus Omnitrophota bacterium]